MTYSGSAWEAEGDVLAGFPWLAPPSVLVSWRREGCKAASSAADDHHADVEMSRTSQDAEQRRV